RDVRLKNTLDTLNVGRAALVGKTGNDYTIAKLLGKSSEVDKITVDFIAVQATPAQTDSLLAVLNSGAAFDSIAASPLAVQSQKGLELSMLDPQMGDLAPEFSSAAVGRWFTPDTVAGAARLFRVADRTAPVVVYDIAQAQLTVEPSATTVNNLEAGLQTFLNSVHNATEFADSARNAGFFAMPATVTASSPMLGNLPDSHNAVAWTMEAKKGQVSPIFGDLQSGRFIAVALRDIYKDYTPVTDPELNTVYAARARAEKKAAKLIADYQGKANDVAGYAALMGVSVDTTDVNFSQTMVPAIGARESALQGAVAASEKGKLVGPIKTNNGVVVLQVTDVTTEGRPYVAEEYAARYNGQRGAQALGNNLPAILIGNKKVDNKMTTFYK
ncbi:MAG: peptidyl-prolyl cis-trans isomerase, partial [Duncaniella sp.]|nr:peptidyl-prolyl cis-trans isomerase [Duncaniella sp.]